MVLPVEVRDVRLGSGLLDRVDRPLELLEVQLCNSTAPFILISRLRPSLRAAVQAGARRAYVVNVSAMEGQFSRRYKGPGHPHTNMAKAALNMLVSSRWRASGCGARLTVLGPSTYRQSSRRRSVRTSLWWRCVRGTSRQVRARLPYLRSLRSVYPNRTRRR